MSISSEGMFLHFSDRERSFIQEGASKELKSARRAYDSKGYGPWESGAISDQSALQSSPVDKAKSLRHEQSFNADNEDGESDTSAFVSLSVRNRRRTGFRR